MIVFLSLPYVHDGRPGRGGNGHGRLAIPGSTGRVYRCAGQCPLERVSVLTHPHPGLGSLYALEGYIHYWIFQLLPSALGTQQ